MQLRRALVFLACVSGALSTGFVLPNYKAPKRASNLPVVVRDPGHVYPSINTGDCLQWPSDAWKTAGGVGAWGGWSVSKGDRGIAIAKTLHCYQHVYVVFIEVGAHFVPIGEPGITFELGSAEDLPKIAPSTSP